MNLNKLVKQSDKRFLDTEGELRIQLKLTLKLHSGHIFYHEDTAKSNQIVACTLSPDGKTLSVVLFTKKIEKKS